MSSSLCDRQPVSSRQVQNLADWQVSKLKVNERSRYLLESSRWSDCQFVVGTEPHQQIFSAHKLFLAMASPVFEAMFYGEMREKNEPIPILDVQPEAFRSLLEYIYTDDVRLNSFDQACELCYVAKKYMIPFLVEECTKYLWGDLNPKNACRAYEFAKLFEEPTLMDKCLKIIRTETESILSEDVFEEIELATLNAVLEQEELNVSSELQLFEAVQRWATSECARQGLDSKSMRAVLGSAIGKIRFLTLTPAEFAEGPALSPLLSQDESFAILLNISSKTSAKLPLPEGFSAAAAPRGRSAVTPAVPASPTPTPLERRLDQLHAAAPALAEARKLYCVREVLHRSHCHNITILDCYVSFSADRNVCVLGLLIPTQVPSPSHPRELLRPEDTYVEVVYAHLLDSDGSRLTYSHTSTRVPFCSELEIAFNRPVYIQRHKTYKVGVVLNKVGWYPTGICERRASCGEVAFSFGVSDARDGVVRSIVFTH